MKNLNDFLKNNEPERRISKIEPFRKEVFQLYEQGFKVEQIIDFLKGEKIETSKQNLYKFLKSKNSSLKTPVVGEANRNTNKTDDINEIDEITISDLRKRFKK